MPVAMMLPFRVGADGSIGTTGNPAVQVRQRIVTVVGTEPGERVMMPNFGVPMVDAVFETGAGIVANELTQLTLRQMAMWEPAVVVQDVQPVLDDAGVVANIDINYVRADAPDTPYRLAANLDTAIIGTNGQIREVIRG